MKLGTERTVNKSTSLLNRHLLLIAFLVSAGIHLAAFGLVMNHRKPFTVVAQNTPILITLIHASSALNIEDSKPIIQPQVNPQLQSQILPEKVVKQKSRTAFAPTKKLPKVQPLIAIEKEKSESFEIAKPQIKHKEPLSPIDKKEDISNQEVSLTQQIDAPRVANISKTLAIAKVTKTDPEIRTGVSISASYAKTNQKPEYPAQSRRLNEEGTVVLKILVLAEGSAGEVEVKSSSGFPMLDQSARDAVKKWHFNPATLDGKPIDEFYSLSIPFKLNG